MQIYSHLLSICPGGLEEIRIVQRCMVSNKKNFTMPSLGWTRL